MQNTLYTNDNLYILNGMNSECVDLIYLDPPFNSKRTYSAPVGTKAAGASFKDMWTWQDVDEGYLDKIVDEYPSLVQFIQSIQVSHSKAMMSYIVYMTQRLIEMHRILKDTGSLYLHCDPTASHYLKQLLDFIFGKDNCRNEISWERNQSSGKGSQHESKRFGNNRDIIYFYTKSNKYYFNPYRSISEEEMIKKFPKIDEKGRRYNTLTPLYCSRTMGARPNLCYEWKGFRNPNASGWRLSKERLEEEYQKGNIVITNNKIERRAYYDEYQGVKFSNNWIDIPRISKNESTGYRTQKPLALLERIIQASSKEGDVVFDPFCGCATTCVAAQKLKRHWIGIDIEKKAVEVLVERLEKDGYMDDLLRFKQKGEDFIHRLDVPQRTDVKIESPDDKSIQERLFKQQEGHCNACGVELDIWHFEVDHIVPKAKGGGNYFENYQLLCSSCNRIKGARPMEYLRIKIATREELLKKTLTFGE